MMEEDQLYAVELSRGTRGFGFSIRGGREFHNMPLFVLRIADQGAAAQDGRLRVRSLLLVHLILEFNLIQYFVFVRWEIS